MSRVLVPLAPGFEEIETTTIVDVLRRGEVEVVLAGLEGTKPHRGSRGMVFLPDVALDTALNDCWDWIVLPGGLGGTEAMAAHGPLVDLVRQRVAARQPVGAICAAPLVLDKAKVLKDNEFTCYPGLQSRIGARGRRPDRVVDAGPVVTSQGPGTAMTFALYLLGKIKGPEVKSTVQAGLLHYD
ncbi:MAG: DJ-1/PfpI family protein [Proteobacteria bacterium]|jgi:protein deglycase|nr:DJ-1/PfpI family protein [Pseudomonadota bacterium]